MNLGKQVFHKRDRLVKYVVFSVLPEGFKGNKWFAMVQFVIMRAADKDGCGS